MKEGISKGMNMKWSLYMSSNQQNLTIGSIRLKSDYRVVKISLTTGLGSYPDQGNMIVFTFSSNRASKTGNLFYHSDRAYLTLPAGLSPV